MRCVRLCVAAHDTPAAASDSRQSPRMLRRKSSFFIDFVFEFDFTSQIFDLPGQLVDLDDQLLLQHLPVGLLPAQGHILLQNLIVLFAQQVDRPLHLGQKIVVALAAADGPRGRGTQKTARQRIGEQIAQPG